MSQLIEYFIIKIEKKESLKTKLSKVIDLSLYVTFLFKLFI